MIELNISLIEGVDRQEFADSFVDKKVALLWYLSEEVSTDLRMSVTEFYLDSVISDPRVASTVEIEANYSPTMSPFLHYQQGTVIVDKSNGSSLNPYILNDDDTFLHRQRPGFPGAVLDVEKRWLGSHYMPLHLYADSDVAGPNRNQNWTSTRDPLGAHTDDASKQGPYGHTSSPSVNVPNPVGGTQYTSQFFGKNIDIITFEGGSPPVDKYIDEADHLFHVGSAWKVPNSEVTVTSTGSGVTVGNVASIGLNEELVITIPSNFSGSSLKYFCALHEEKIVDIPVVETTGTNVTRTVFVQLAKDNDEDPYFKFYNEIGEDDIDLVLEKGSTTTIRRIDYYHYFEEVYHPDFGSVQESNDNILQNDPLNNGDAPNGAYTIPGTRINLYDWTGPASTGSTLGSDNALKSRYLNQSLPKAARNPLTSHAMGSLSVSAGLICGTAKKANLYLAYTANNGSEVLRSIINWHKNKERNPGVKYYDPSDSLTLTQGAKNPTVLNLEFQHSFDKQFFTPVDRISAIYDAKTSTTINRPSGGWGSDLTPFVNLNMIPHRLEDPENLGTFFWTIPWGKGGSPYPSDFRPSYRDTHRNALNKHGPDNELKDLLAEAWDAGIVVIGGPGNSAAVGVKRDDVEYNSYFTVDANSNSYEKVWKDDWSGVKLYQPISSGTQYRKIHPFRFDGPTGNYRDKEIVVGAIQNSETHPILENYSTRGPMIDILARGGGTFSARGNEYRFPADTSLGSTWPLDSSDSAYTTGALSSTGFPFVAGDMLRIENLGSNPSAWNTYVGAKTVGYKVGDLFRLPSSTANIPTGATVAQPGWAYGYYGGCSCSGPIAAGKLTAIMEEFLHTNGRWPTPIESKLALLAQAEEIDIEAPSAYWPNVPSPAFGRNINSDTKYLSPHRYRSAYEDCLEVQGTSQNIFSTSTGEVKPNLFGWTLNNTSSIQLNNTSIASVSTDKSRNFNIKEFRSRYNSAWESEAAPGTFNPAFRYQITFNPEAAPGLVDGDAIQITRAEFDSTLDINGNPAAGRTLDDPFTAGQTLYVRRQTPNTFLLYTDSQLVNHLETSGNDKAYIRKTGFIGFETTMTVADGSDVFETIAGANTVINIGDKIVVGGTNSSFNSGTYTVLEGNFTPYNSGWAGPTNFITNKVSSIKLFHPSQMLSTPEDAFITNFTNSTFHLTAFDVNKITPNDGITINLTNSVSGTPASLTAPVAIEKDGLYTISVDSTEPVNIKLIPRGLSAVVDHGSLLASGTITAGAGHTIVSHVGVTSDNRLASAKFFDQLKTSTFDFDGNGSADALTDGLLYLRYLFELSGDALLKDAVALDSPLTEDEIVRRLAAATQSFGDIDGDGQLDALTDGLLLLRYLFQLRGDALISQTISLGATRTTSAQIVDYVENIIGREDVYTYGYRDSDSSAVKHSNASVLQEPFQTTIRYSVSANSPKLLDYQNHVSAEMWEQGTFNNIPDKIAAGPYTKYDTCAWTWTKENGTFWASDDMGSVSSTTFTDSSNTTRTIKDMWWTEGQNSWTNANNGYVNKRTQKGILCFSLEGTNIPNTSATFSTLTVGTRSFSRADAFYKSDSHGNTVWWWHITRAPVDTADWPKLPVKDNTVAWSLSGQEQKNEVVYKANPTDMTYDINHSRSAVCDLTITNLQPTVGHSTEIKGVSVRRTKTDDWSQMVTAFSPNNQYQKSNGDLYSINAIAAGYMTDSAGTPPLKAVYNGMGSAKEKFTIAPIQKTSPTSSSVGAVFPNNPTILTSSNDVSGMELDNKLTKFGWNRQASDNGVEPVDETSAPTIMPLKDFFEKGDDEIASTTVDTSLLQVQPVPYLDISSGNIAVPTVPTNNGDFTVGNPVKGTIDPTNSGTISYRWQKSANGSTWTDISDTDTVYTNAGTGQMTVTGYSAQAPVGEYYRCKISAVGNNLENILDITTNVVVAVAE